MSIVIVRLDLDLFDLKTIEKLVTTSVITMGEATEAKCVCKMNDFEKLMWVREMQKMREPITGYMNKVS